MAKNHEAENMLKTKGRKRAFSKNEAENILKTKPLNEKRGDSKRAWQNAPQKESPSGPGGRRKRRQEVTIGAPLDFSPRVGKGGAEEAAEKIIRLSF
jgi:hypothetical protein